MRLLVLLSILSLSVSAQAGKEKLLGRFTVGQAQTDADDLDAVMTTHGIEDFKNLNKFGLELTYPVLGSLELGGRFEELSASRPATSGSTSTDGSIKQQTFQLIARLPFIETSIFRMDIFGGYGASNTIIKVYSPSQTGKFENTSVNRWHNSSLSSYGLSAALGYKGFYLFLEGGYQTNTVSDFEKSGNLSSNLPSLDISGPYASVGVLLDGTFMGGSGGGGGRRSK